MTTGLSDAVRTARLQAITDLLDGGSILFYSGARPAVAGGSPAGVLQATSVLPAPAGTIAVNDAVNPSTVTFTFGTVGDALRVAAATIVWARFVDASSVFVMDVSVGLLGSPGVPAEEILLSALTGAVGTFLHVSSGSMAG